MLQKILLLSGLFSSLLYIALNILCPLFYPGYDSASQTVSELSAIGAPTRSFWVLIVTFYSLFVTAFGWGILQVASENRKLRMVGMLLVINAIIGLFWPPMHQRVALAAGEKSLTDALHIVFTAVTVPMMMVIIGFGAASLGKRFRNYSIITLAILFLALSMRDSSRSKYSLPPLMRLILFSVIKLFAILFFFNRISSSRCRLQNYLY